MVLHEVTAREVQRRMARAVLTVLSIVIGVAAIVAVSLAINESRRSYREMYQALAGRAALEVVSDTGGACPESLAERLGKAEGVRAAVPMVQHVTVMYHHGQRYQLLALGVDPARDRQIRDYEVQAGRNIERSGEAVLESGFARAAGVEVNEEVKLLTRRGLQKVTIVGLLSPRGMAGFSQLGTIFLPLTSAERFFHRAGEVDTIALVLDEHADAAAVASRIRAELPQGLKVQEPAERARLGSDVFLSAEQGLRFAGGLTMTLAVFIIFNTFMMNVGERKRQLALLRTIGATRWQIQGMLLGEALVMGVVGTAVGLLFGLWGAKFLLGALALLGGAPLPAPQWPMGPFLLAGILGPAMALLGVYVPARMAGAVSPLESIRAPSLFDSQQVSRWMTLAGIIIFVGSGLTVAACIRGWLPIAVSIPSGVIFLASFALVIPFLLRPVGWLIAKLLGPWLGVEAELAENQLTRRSMRCGLAAGVLYIAVATAVGLGTIILSNAADVRGWYRKTMVGDFFVRGTFLDQSTRQTLPLPESIEDDIRHMDGVVSVQSVRFLPIKVGDRPALLMIQELVDPNDLPLRLISGKPAEVRRALDAGEVVVGTVLAQRLGIHPGDSIELQTSQGIRRVTVAGTAVDYAVGGLTVYMVRSAAQQILQIEGLDAVAIRAKPSELGAVYGRLQTYCQQHGLLLHSFAEISAIIDRIMNGLLYGLWGLLALGLAVAGFGIANTLTMNVLEQTREIALLRAIAMTRPQVRRMVLSEAGMIATIGLLLGTFGGLTTAYVIGLCMVPLIGYSLPFALHPVLLIGIFPTVLVIVLVSAWFPMRRATHLDLLVALAYE